MKSKFLAYLLLFMFGVLGIHKFYLKKTGMRILYIFTLGIFGIGLIYDLFTLPMQVNKCNKRIYEEIYDY